MQKLIECVPNFSEGRDPGIIRQITNAIASGDGVSLLDVDPGATTNRTVVTFVGSPETVVEGAFRGIQKAAELIDMRKHKGAHPRMGATDVCPFIPISNVNWKEAIACAKALGKRVGDELKIPVYLYEKAAKNPERANLAIIREGEYEGFFDKKGQPIRVPGMLKHVKAIGWYVEEYGIAQVSMNLTNIEETPLHAAFDACDQSATKRGLRVTGSEIVGMVPKKCLIDAGKHFLQKQNWSEGLAEEELIELAIRSMGLSELKPFDPKEKIIELKIEATILKKSMVKLDLRRFCNETLSDSPAPGGGSVAALMGALGASLGGMVANLSAGKRGWEDKLRYFSDWAVKAQQLKDEMLLLVDEDTAAFNKVMAAFALPKGSAKEKSVRLAAIEAANKLATEVPLRVMQTASKTYDLLGEMASKGNPASISDVGVGLLAVRACIDGAGMNVRINVANLKDKKIRSALSDKLQVFSGESEARFKKISKLVKKKFR